jgi:hypothetical protein
MVCFQNLQMLAAGVRPSSGAATSVSQERMELRRTCSWRTWLWPGTATLRILKTRPKEWADPNEQKHNKQRFGDLIIVNYIVIRI